MRINREGISSVCAIEVVKTRQRTCIMTGDVLQALANGDKTANDNPREFSSARHGGK